MTSVAKLPCRVLHIQDKQVLAALNMPFLRFGGLFIPGPTGYVLGEQLFLLLKLPGASNHLPASTAVVWITPERAQGTRHAGIGVGFAESDLSLRSRIEQCLVNVADQPRMSQTL